MGAVNLATEIPSQRAAHDHIRGKVLLGSNTSDGHRGRQPVRCHLTEPSRIFMGPYAGQRPCNRRVFRRKGCSAVEEIPVFISLKRALPLRDSLEQISHSRTVDGSLAAEQSGFLQMIVMVQIAKRECGPTQTKHGVRGVIRNVKAGPNMIGAHLLRPPAIARNECGSHAGGRQYPSEIFHLKTRGSCPEFSLVPRQMLEER